MHPKMFIKSPSEGGAGLCNSQDSSYETVTLSILEEMLNSTQEVSRFPCFCVLGVGGAVPSEYAPNGDGYVPWQGIKLPTFW